MGDAMLRMLDAAATFWGAAWPSATLKGALLLLLAAGASGLLRRRSAAVRHLVWTLALAGVVTLPLVGATGLRLAVLPAWATSPRATTSPATSRVVLPSPPVRNSTPDSSPMCFGFPGPVTST